MLLNPNRGALWLGAASAEEARALVLPETWVQAGRAIRGVDGVRRAFGYPDKVAPSASGLPRRAGRPHWTRDSSEEIPLLWVPSVGWDGGWDRYWTANEPPDAWRPWGRISGDWHGLVELERRLMEPYVIRADEGTLQIGRRFTRNEPPGSRLHQRTYVGHVDVRDVRLWRSLLAPIYLQLFEGLRRVSEGDSGAARCHECGQPFLTLDARRTSFCNDRERFRYSQRSRRERLAMAGAIGNDGRPK